MDYEGTYSHKWTQDWRTTVLLIWDNLIKMNGLLRGILTEINPRFMYRGTTLLHICNYKFTQDPHRHHCSYVRHDFNFKPLQDCTIMWGPTYAKFSEIIYVNLDLFILHNFTTSRLYMLIRGPTRTWLAACHNNTPVANGPHVMYSQLCRKSVYRATIYGTWSYNYPGWSIKEFKVSMVIM